MHTTVDTAMNASIAGRPWPIRHLRLVVHGFAVYVWCNITLGACIPGFDIVFIVPLASFGITASHPDIPSDAYTASLVGDCSTDECTLGQARELLGTVYDKRLRPDLEAEVTVGLRSHWPTQHLLGVGIGRGWHSIFILGVFDMFVQCEVQPVFALVPHRQIGEDEVASGIWTIEISHAGDRHPGQNGHCVGDRMHSRLGDWPGTLEGGEEEEAGIIWEGDVLFLLAFEYAQAYDRRRVNGPTVC